MFVGLRMPDIGKVTPIENKLPNASANALSFLKACLIYDPEQRAATKHLMEHPFFTGDSFVDKFEAELKRCIEQEKERDANERSKRKKLRVRNTVRRLTDPISCRSLCSRTRSL